MESLPLEVQLRILALAPELRWASRTLYTLHNHVVRAQFLRLMPMDKFDKVRPVLLEWLAGMRFYNGALQALVAPEPLWFAALAFVSNRKLFFRGFEDVVVQSDDRGVALEPYTSVTLKTARSIYYNRTVSLPSGSYNYQLALASHFNSVGLGTLKLALEGGFVNYPPVNLNEMCEENKCTLFNAGKFELVGGRHKLHRFEVTLEESGMRLKRHLDLHYIDFKPCALGPGLEPLFYTLDSALGCHPLEKRVHIAIDIVLDKDGDMSRLPPLEDVGVSLEEFVTTGGRTVKMLNAVDQRRISGLSAGGPLLRPWKVPF